MKSIRLFLLLGLALLVALGARLTLAQGGSTHSSVSSAFTYQGHLTDASGNPVDDTCNFRFSLWDDATTGAQTGSTLDVPGIYLEGGLFTVQLDFGPVFDGTALWLKIEVQCSGDVAYVALNPRQALTAAPYTLYALDADMLDGQDASAFAATSHLHSAADVTSGTLETDRYSAYEDVVSEGYLNNDDDDDLLTRIQTDGRFVNEAQADSVTSAMIVDGEVTADDLQDGAALTQILDDDGAGSGLDADMLDGLQSADLARIGRYYIPGGSGGNVAIAIPHYSAFQLTIGEAFGSPNSVVWLSGIENDGDLAWVAISSSGVVSTGTCDLSNSTQILTLDAYITLSCPGNGNLELSLVSSYEDVQAFIIW